MSRIMAIGDVADIQRGSIDPRKYPDTRFELYSIPGFDNCRTPEQLVGADIGSNKSVLPEQGVLFSKLNPRINRVWTFGGTGTAKRIASTEFVCLVPDESRLDLEYLGWRLRVPSIVDELPAATAAATKSRQRIKPRSLLELPILLPSLDEQQRIVSILNRAARIERLRKRAVDRLREFVPALFLKMFGDPVENPMRWDVTELSTLGSLDRGRSRHRPRNALELYGGPYPFVQTGDVSNSDGLVRIASQTYSEIGLRQSRLWPAGTLCITIAANISKTGILSFDACFPDSIVGFTPNASITAEYVQSALDLMQTRIEETAPMSAQRNINLRTLRELRIPVPNLSQQQRFVKIVGSTRAISALGAASLPVAVNLTGFLASRFFVARA